MTSPNAVHASDYYVTAEQISVYGCSAVLLCNHHHHHISSNQY